MKEHFSKYSNSSKPKVTKYDTIVDNPIYIYIYMKVVKGVYDAYF